MTVSAVQVERRGGIVHLVLASPPRNALTLAALDALRDAIDALGTEPPQAVVVRGQGRHFSSGADVEELIGLSRDRATAEARLQSHDRAFAVIACSAVPMVAAISGCCLGVGLELALCCHARIAAQGAVLSLPEASFGLLPGCGGLVRLATLCGPSAALELSLSGRTVCAEEALTMGLVDRVVSRHDLEAEATRLAEILGAGALKGFP